MSNMKCYQVKCPLCGYDKPEGQFHTKTANGSYTVWCMQCEKPFNIIMEKGIALIHKDGILDQKIKPFHVIR
jgi:hypothetical protein